jgi:hypothetical protein
MIELIKITPPTIDLYAPDASYLGCLNEYEFHYARVQIKKESKYGYYVIFDSKKIQIDKFGNLKEWPNGMFDQLSDLYSQLF